MMKKINFGCGGNFLEGWENYDAEVDITKPLPFEDSSTDFILAEHVYEHIKPREGILFLRECHRILKPTGVIINVARGPIINEAAIYKALKNHEIGGALLDVWYQYASTDNLEMQPSVLPFHDLDNVIMTPHTASWTDQLDQRRIDSVVKNIQNFIDQKPLAEVVF